MRGSRQVVPLDDQEYGFFFLTRQEYGLAQTRLAEAVKQINRQQGLKLRGIPNNK